MLNTMVRADGIAIIPAEWASVRAGTEVDVQVLRGALDARPA
jgi:molybdopterin biosynthesis enzyme